MKSTNKQLITELTLNLKNANDKITSQKEEIDLLKKKLNGDRVCDKYCSRCIHGIVNTVYTCYNAISARQTYQCELDCKCKDFKEKEK